MKTLTFRLQFPLMVMALMMTGAISAHAARLRHVSVFQTEVFQITKTTKIVVGTDHSATLGDLNIGDRVSIAYEQENGAQVAHHIADGVPHKPQNLGVNPVPNSPPPSKPAKPSAFLHVHGIVQSI